MNLCILPGRKKAETFLGSEPGAPCLGKAFQFWDFLPFWFKGELVAQTFQCFSFLVRIFKLRPERGPVTRSNVVRQNGLGTISKPVELWKFLRLKEPHFAGQSDARQDVHASFQLNYQTSWSIIETRLG
jgi:hypothetical protein